MLLIFTRIIVVFSMVAIGFGANKLNVLPTESNKYLIALLMDVATPCLLLTSITGRELTDDTVRITIVTMVGALLFFAVGMVIAYGLTVLLKVPKTDRGVYTGIITLVNNGFMGFPITRAAFGDDAMYLMVLCNIVLCIWTFTAGFLEINLGTGKFNLKELRSNFKSMINPCSVVSVLGIILLFAQIKIPDILFSIFETVGQITVPLSMIVVGVQLGESHIRSIIRNRKLVMSAAIKLVLVPLLTFLAVYWLPVNEMVKLVLTLSACFPSAVNLVAIVSKENGNATLASEGVAVTTLFSMISLPVAILLLTSVFNMF